MYSESFHEWCLRDLIGHRRISVDQNFLENLSEVLQPNQTIQRLDLSYTDWDVSIEELFKILDNKIIDSVDLSFSTFPSFDCRKFGDLVKKHKTIKSIILEKSRGLFTTNSSQSNPKRGQPLKTLGCKQISQSPASFFWSATTTPEEKQVISILLRLSFLKCHGG